MNNNAKNSPSSRKKTYLLITLVIFLILVVVVGFEIEKSATVSLATSLSQTNVFIDQDKKITTTKDNEKVSFKVSPGNHSVLISHVGYFPWKKDFSVKN